MRKILGVAALSLLCTSALAGDVNVKLRGAFDFQTGYKKQSKLKDKQAGKYVSANQKNFAFDSDAGLMAELSAEENGVKYGGRVVIDTTARSTSSSSYNGSHIYVEHSAGRLELGANYDAASQMQLSAYDIASATGDDWSNYISDNAFNGGSYLTSVDFFIENYTSNRRPETPRKITYFTPEMNGVSLGVSYIPDSANIGAGSMSSTSSRTASLGIKSSDFGGRDIHVKNAFAGGASWKYDMSNAASIQVAATGEYGKPVEKSNTVAVAAAGVGTVNKVRKLSSYNVGAKVKWDQFSVAASYGTWNKSLLVKNVDTSKENTKFYTAGAAYNQGPVGASVTYFNSDHRSNKLRAITVGTDYKLMPGLKPYAEVTYFSARPGKVAKAADVTKTNGTVAILGAKLQF